MKWTIVLLLCAFSGFVFADAMACNGATPNVECDSIANDMFGFVGGNFATLGMATVRSVKDGDDDKPVKIKFFDTSKGINGPKGFRLKFPGLDSDFFRGLFGGRPTNPPMPGGCVDSDGGVNFTEYGNISNGTHWYSDVCVSETALREYSCDGSRIYTENIYYCGNLGAGWACSNGECVPPPVMICTDSDGGMMPWTSGTTSNGTNTDSDYCIGNSLTEYWCNGNAIANSPVTCTYGCFGGSQGYCSNPP